MTLKKIVALPRGLMTVLPQGLGSMLGAMALALSAPRAGELCKPAEEV